MAFSCYAESFMDFYTHCSCHRSRRLQPRERDVEKFPINFILFFVQTGEVNITCMALINGQLQRGVRSGKTFFLAIYCGSIKIEFFGKSSRLPSEQSLQIIVDVCQAFFVERPGPQEGGIDKVTSRMSSEMC